MQLNTILGGILGLMAISAFAMPAQIDTVAITQVSIATITHVSTATTSQAPITSPSDGPINGSAPFQLSSDVQKLYDAFTAMKMDDEGQLHLADDGVMRSYDGDGKVIDCKLMER